MARKIPVTIVPMRSPPSAGNNNAAHQHRESVILFADLGTHLLRNASVPIVKPAMGLLDLIVISPAKSDEWPAL
jgi:hypothetical protein